MRRLQDEFGIALILITHDLGVVAEIADEVLVMYAGRWPRGRPADLFYRPHHPYTKGLLESIPGSTGRPAATAHGPSPAPRRR